MSQNLCELYYTLSVVIIYILQSVLFKHKDSIFATRYQDEERISIIKSWRHERHPVILPN